MQYSVYMALNTYIVNGLEGYKKGYREDREQWFIWHWCCVAVETLYAVYGFDIYLQSALGLSTSYLQDYPEL